MSKSQINATVILALTSAIAIAGEVLKPGTPDKPTLIEVSQDEARDLLHRGKAVLHDHNPESGIPVFSSGAGRQGPQSVADAEAAAAADEAAELAAKEAADKDAAQAAAAAKTGKRK